MRPPAAPERSKRPPPAPERAKRPPPERGVAQTPIPLIPQPNGERALAPTFENVVDLSSAAGAVAPFPSGLIPIYIEDPPDAFDTERPSVRDLIAEKLVPVPPRKRRKAPTLLAAMLCVACGVIGYDVYFRFLIQPPTMGDRAPAPALGVGQAPQPPPPALPAPAEPPPKTTPTASTPAAPPAAADAVAPLSTAQPTTPPVQRRARDDIPPPATLPSSEPEAPPPAEVVEPDESPYDFAPTEP
jgi:hypothetical protein